MDRGYADDLLTRTTLLIDENASASAIDRARCAIERVPGVLLAQIAAGSFRAVVAHDDAVPNASLLAAAAGAGVHARIVGDTPAPAAIASTGLRVIDLQSRRFLTSIAALIFLLALVEAIYPRLASNYLLLPIVLSCSWAALIGFTMFRRKQ